MATFKVGQRVRIVKVGWEGIKHAVGQEVTIIAVGCHQFGQYEVTPPVGPLSDCRWYGEAECFAPLTDPGADAFLARIKNLKPYEEPVVETFRIRVPDAYK